MPAPAPVSVPVHRVTASPEAEKWYQDALVQSRGEGGRKDPYAAFDLFSKAAELGHSQAQTSLGLMLLHGNGTRPDPAKGLDWLKKSASAGDPEGMFWLGMSLPPESAYDKADWLRMSAGHGYGPAQIALANLYTAGQGVPVDFLEAYRWLVSAAAGGDSSAGPLMEFVSRFLSEADIREARRRAGSGAR